MPLVLNEEQRLLQETAKDFFAKHAPIAALRALRDTGDETGYSTELWQKMVEEMGWSGIIFPETFGGLDFGYAGLGVTLTESGRTLCASPLFASVALCGSALLIAASAEQQATYLPALITGETNFALAFEEGRHHQPHAVATRAEQDGADYRLSGSKVFVLDGHSADQLIVSARQTNGEIGLFVVDANSPGVTRRRTSMLDSRNAANIEFDQTPAAKSQLLEGGGADTLDQILDRGRIMLAAEMLGSAEEVFTRTVAYLKEREQFGSKIGAFQALQHRAAHVFCELEGARACVLAAQAAIDENDPQLSQMASMTKAKVNDTFELAAAESVQMHGGIAMTDEVEIGFFLKRARVTLGSLGDSSFHRQRYAALRGF